MAYSLAELIEVVRCLEGDAFANELAAATDPVTGTVAVHEQWTPPHANGVSDHDTIMINSKDTQGQPRLSKVEAAAVLAHEYEHVQHRAGATEDPVTNALPCGSCAHAAMFVDSAVSIWRCYCGSSSTTVATPDEVCDALGLAFDAAYEAFAECVEEGCPGSLISATVHEITLTEISILESCCQF